MRSSVYNVPVQFRLSQQLLTAAREKAEQVGITFSELLRSALRREIGLIDQAKTALRQLPPASPVLANGMLGPTVSAIVERGSQGDLECQRFLFQDRVDALRNSGITVGNRMLIAMEAITFGRLVASRGDHHDIRRFAGVLCHALTVFKEGGWLDHADFLMAECVSVLEQLAECGDDLAAVSAEALIKDSPVTLPDRVRTIRKRALEEETA